MRFRAQVSDLNEALALVSIVAPRPVGGQGSGYLLTVKGDTCTVYSQDNTRKVRTSFSVTDADGEGSFILPTEKVSSLKYLDGFADFTYGKSDDRHYIEYQSESGAHQEITTFDPLSIKPFDDEMANPESTSEYPVALLREGITLMRGFVQPIGENKAPEPYKSIQLFDGSQEATKKGNGTLYAADGTRAAYFHCEALMDKTLAIHGQHLPTLLSFLSKCDGEVKLLSCASTTFLVNSAGQAFGWAHQSKRLEKYAYYGLKTDTYVLRVAKDILVKALRYIRGGLDAKQDKIRLLYKADGQTLRVIASEDTGKIESAPIGVLPIEEAETGAGGLGTKEDFATNLNLNHFLEVIEPVKGNEVILRVAIHPENGQAMIRTIEDFLLNEQGKVVIQAEEGKKAYPCKVTRFVPSRK